MTVNDDKSGNYSHVEGLKNEIIKRVADKNFDGTTQAYLIRTLKYLKWITDGEKNQQHQDALPFCKQLLESLKQDSPSGMLILESIQQIRFSIWTSSPGCWGRFQRRFGNSAADAMIGGAIIAVLAWTAVIIGIFLVGVFSSAQGETTFIAIPIQYLVPLLAAALIGSFVSLTEVKHLDSRTC